MPQREVVAELFSQLASSDGQKKFFEQVADNVDWWIVGSTPMSGTYKSKQSFLDATLELLNGRVLGGPLRFRLLNVVADSESNWATVELEAIDAQCKNGKPYSMRYCWVARFNTDNVIEQVRAYLDTQLLSECMEQNQ